MAIRATHVATGREIDLDRADEPEMAELINQMHRNTTSGDRPRGDREVLECREHDGPDGPHHGAWVCVKRDRFGRWVLAHLDAKYSNHTAGGMTDQHRWQQDYWLRAGVAAGYEAIKEKPLPGIRPDVAILGPKATIGVEVQRSALLRSAALARTTKARNNGVTSLWSSDKPAAPPKWAYAVPTILTNELPERHAPRGSWTVVNGLRTVIAQRCARPWFHDNSYEGFGGICPKTNRSRPCGGWHARFTPTFGMTVDDVAEQAPAGEMLPLTLRRRRAPIVYIVTAKDAGLYAELADGTYNDPEQAARDAAAEPANLGKIGPCQATVPTGGPLTTLTTRIPTQRGTPMLRSATAADLPAPEGCCRFCGEPLPPAKVRMGIRNHLSCWQNQGAPAVEP